jgi:predicted glycosyltransferase
MTVRALIYVQHLLGIGHFARTSRIASNLSKAGVRTVIVQGGSKTGISPPESAELIQLTPAKVSADDMSTLLHPDGRLFTDADRLARRDHLLASLREIEPQILITEAFPFGRRQMRFELLPLLDEAKARKVPVIACSIRDILQESRKPGRAEETVALLERYFDLVLVHGDRKVTPLAMTFPLAHLIEDITRYSGLVGPDRPRSISRAHAVVVSAGGGSVGARLLDAAIGAAPLSPFRNEPWLVLSGPNLPDTDFARLTAKAEAASGTITLLRSVPDLSSHLAGAKVSVSQAGYNTVADILAAGCPAVLTPFAAGGETEQITRADALAASGRAVVLREESLNPAAMAEAIGRAIALSPARAEHLDGGERTAALLLEELGKRSTVKMPIATGGTLLSSPLGARS